MEEIHNMIIEIFLTTNDGDDLTGEELLELETNLNSDFPDMNKIEEIYDKYIM